MNGKKYFYFANPHSFTYPIYVKLIFKKINGHIIHRTNHSEWIEVENYRYYGEPVNCIIPAKTLEYDFVFNLISSEITDNVFGAINYMLCNYREKFLQQVNSGMCRFSNTHVLLRFLSIGNGFGNTKSTGDG